MTRDTNRGRSSKSGRTTPPKHSSKQPRIRPIVMYPYVQPRDLESLGRLFELLGDWCRDPTFCRPLVVINNQTRFRSTKPAVDDPRVDAAYRRAVKEIISPVGQVIHSWAVDSCAMWLRGLGDAFEEATDAGAFHDVFFLIPGDFDFSNKEGEKALSKLREIPLKVSSNECAICLGEIHVPPSSANPKTAIGVGKNQEAPLAIGFRASTIPTQ